MYATVSNPHPNTVSISRQTLGILLKVGDGDGEIHLRFGTPGDAVQFFLDAAHMVRAAMDELERVMEAGE